MNARQLALRPVTPDMPEPGLMFGNTPLSSRMHTQPHPSWPLESADFFSDKPEEMTPLNIQNLFGCSLLFNSLHLSFQASSQRLPIVFLLPPVSAGTSAELLLLFLPSLRLGLT